MDRTDYWLKLHSVPAKQVTEEIVWDTSEQTLWLGSAAPWEVLLARTEVTLVKQPRILVQLSTVVDTPPFFNRRSSPLVNGERYVDDYGQYEYVRGMIHPSAEPLMRYPELNGLQYIFAHPELRVLSRLLENTCFCPHDWFIYPNATCFAWLCEVIERSVITMLLPVDAGWDKFVTHPALDYLFHNRDAAAETIMYWIFGPLTVMQNCTGSRSGRCEPVGVVSVRPGLIQTGLSQARLAEEAPQYALHNKARWLQQEPDLALQPDGEDAVPPQPRGSGRQLYLGQVNTTPGDAFDDPIDWTRPVDRYVGIIPFPTYIYEAQIGDLIRADWHHLQLTIFGSFAPLWNRTLIDILIASFLLTNDTAYAPLGYNATLQALLGGLFGDEIGHSHPWHHILALFNSTCFVPLGNGTWSVADLGIEPAQVAFSFEPLKYFYESACAHGCRRLSSASEPQQVHLDASTAGMAEGASAEGGSESAWDTHRADEAYTKDTPAAARTLTQGPGDDDCNCAPPLIVTGIDHHDCMRPDSANWARVIRHANCTSDIETLNALMMKIDQPVFPPNVLRRFWEVGIRPFYSSPPAFDLPHPRSRCPYSPVREGSLARLLLALQLADPDQGFLP